MLLVPQLQERMSYLCKIPLCMKINQYNWKLFQISYLNTKGSNNKQGSLTPQQQETLPTSHNPTGGTGPFHKGQKFWPILATWKERKSFLAKEQDPNHEDDVRIKTSRPHGTQEPPSSKFQQLPESWNPGTIQCGKSNWCFKTWFSTPWLQTILQTYSSQDSTVLAQK